MQYVVGVESDISVIIQKNVIKKYLATAEKQLCQNVKIVGPTKLPGILKTFTANTVVTGTSLIGCLDIDTSRNTK